MKTGKKLVLTAVLVSLLMASIGISYAWFAQRAALSTLINIIPPDSIKIVPIDDKGGDVVMLDLDFNEAYNDEKNEDTGKITIYRPVYIYSTSPVHQLEVVHTTNLNQLSFAIYPATKNEGGSITYDREKKLSGEDKNPSTDNPKLAEPANLNNYKEGDSVEAHAYPLYWLAGNSGDKNFVDDKDWDKIVEEVNSKKSQEYDPAKQDYRTYYKTYYYLEISWQEDSKETDLFYIMAQNIAVAENNEGSVSTP